MDASMRDALAEVEKDRSQLSGVIVSRYNSLLLLDYFYRIRVEISNYPGLPPVYLVNALARGKAVLKARAKVRVRFKDKVRARVRVKDRARCKVRVEKEQMPAGVVKETPNSRSKAGL